jgi:IS5 family transposase
MRAMAAHQGGVKDRLMHRPNKHDPELPLRQKRRNRLIGRIRAAVERPFAVFKERYGMRRLRAYTVVRNRVQVVLACCAYNRRCAVSILAPARGGLCLPVINHAESPQIIPHR